MDLFACLFGSPPETPHPTYRMPLVTHFPCLLSVFSQCSLPQSIIMSPFSKKGINPSNTLSLHKLSFQHAVHDALVWVLQSNKDALLSEELRHTTAHRAASDHGYALNVKAFRHIDGRLSLVAEICNLDVGHLRF
ncbi:hypothetical protein KC341_g47 [Hortaea werneckii]|nr:hypothetical protein KC341_g47 [Hortaea werneckii]